MHPLLPYAIMGIMALFAALLCILLPETRFKPTLENIDQAMGNKNSGDGEKEDDTAGNEEKKALVKDEAASKV